MQWGRAAAGMEAVGPPSDSNDDDVFDLFFQNATVAKVDNLVWLPRARKNENWSRLTSLVQGPVVTLPVCTG